MPRVLVVDDEARILRFTQVALKSSGYDVVTATTGREALQRTQSAKPDIIVMDVLMPDMEGFELLRKLRSSLDVPIIAFSARSGIADKAVASGASDFLPKPFRPEELVKRVEALLPSGGEPGDA